MERSIVRFIKNNATTGVVIRCSKEEHAERLMNILAQTDIGWPILENGRPVTMWHKFQDDMAYNFKLGNDHTRVRFGHCSNTWYLANEPYNQGKFIDFYDFVHDDII